MAKGKFSITLGKPGKPWVGDLFVRAGSVSDGRRRGVAVAYASGSEPARIPRSDDTAENLRRKHRRPRGVKSGRCGLIPRWERRFEKSDPQS